MHRAEARLLLYRRARLAEDPRPPRRAAEGRARLHRRRHRAASMRRSASTSARCRRRRSRVAIMGEITAGGCAKNRHETARMKFGPVPPRRGDRRHRRAHHPPGRARAQEGHADRRPRRSRRSRRPASRTSWWRGSSRATCPRTQAAAEIAKAVAGEGVHVERAFTGRANLFADAAGVLVVDGPPSTGSTASTRRSRSRRLPAFKPVVEGEMIATVKIIPFASRRGCAMRPRWRPPARPLIRVAPYRIKKVGVVSTLLPGLRQR